MHFITGKIATVWNFNRFTIEGNDNYFRVISIESSEESIKREMNVKNLKDLQGKKVLINTERKRIYDASAERHTAGLHCNIRFA